jgi:riboflavin biosynthesis pyrimidine reductase
VGAEGSSSEEEGVSELLQLLPATGDTVPLRGAYLSQDLRTLDSGDGPPYIYSNYVVSLDGRIAIPRDDGYGLRVPPAIANDRDWRLYQELAAQADVVLTSGRYLRDLAAGRARPCLEIDYRRHPDLEAWRRARDLAPHPDVAVVSGSLAFRVPESATVSGRRFVVLTGPAADTGRVAEIEAHGGDVVVLEGEVSGAGIAAAIASLGLRIAYSIAGPRVLHLLLEGDVLARLYITLAGRLLGGAQYASVVEGEVLSEPVGMRLAAACLDRSAGATGGQLFLTYERDR